MYLKLIHKKLLSIVLILLLLIIILLVWDKERMWAYYKNENSFLSSSGVVAYLYHDKDMEQIYISFSDIDPSFHDHSFKIVGMNYKIVIQNGLLDSLSVGDHVEFVGSPRVFGDGYVLPLIGISKNDNLFLDPVQGYHNFLDWLRSRL